MIPDLFIYLLTFIASLVVFILKLIPFLIPDSWETAIESMFGYFGYFQGWLPLYPNPAATGLWHDIGIMTIVGWFLTAIVAIYLLKGAVMVVHLFTFGKISMKIPSFGKGRPIKQ